MCLLKSNLGLWHRLRQPRVCHWTTTTSAAATSVVQRCSGRQKSNSSNNKLQRIDSDDRRDLLMKNKLNMAKKWCLFYRNLFCEIKEKSYLQNWSFRSKNKEYVIDIFIRDEKKRNNDKHIFQFPTICTKSKFMSETKYKCNQKIFSWKVCCDKQKHSMLWKSTM